MCWRPKFSSFFLTVFTIGLSWARFWRTFGISGGGVWTSQPPSPRYATGRVGILAIIRCRIFCLPVCRLKIWRLRHTKLKFCLLFCTGVKLGLSHWWTNVGREGLKIVLPRTVFTPKRDEIAGKCWRLHTEELYDMYRLPNIFRTIKSRRKTWIRKCGIYGGQERYIQGLTGNRSERDYLDYLGFDGCIILKWIF